jgi:UDP-GlcNAc:undecaprenyl-phosphate GlcNAc-1-phosphate transferase
MIYFSTLLLAMFITLVLIPILKRYAGFLHCVDVPCERKVHCEPVPKVGGIAMALGILAPAFVSAYGDKMILSIMLGAAIIVAFGVLDDVRELGYKAKFTGQLAAASLVVFWGGIRICSLGNVLPGEMVLPQWLAVILSIFMIVGVTNAVNLADGLDGLAGGLMLLSFLCISFMAYRVDFTSVAVLSAATAGAIFGFLRYNTHPAMIFMGDAGSQLLGFLAITMSIAITQGSSPYNVLFPLILLGLPILDTLWVMAERVKKGQSPFVADKNHLHHKLMKFGLYHTEAVASLYILQAAMVSSAFLLRFYPETTALAAYLGISLGIVAVIGVLDRHGWRLERPGVLDRLIKDRLKIYIKERYVGIKVSQIVIEIGFPLLLIVSCVIPAGLPMPIGLAAAAAVLAILFIVLYRPDRLHVILRLVVYFLLPLILYYGEVNRLPWVPNEFVRWFSLNFVILVFFAVMTLKLTRRREGFKLKPIDFIILFVAIVIPNLPDAALNSYHAGPLATKIVVFFFVFEVLVGELRGNLSRLGVAVAISMLVAAVKGLI